MDEESGLVVTDAEKCIGCKLCVEACPYQARAFIEEEPSYYQGFKTGYADVPDHIANTVGKCTFCKNRLDKGEIPACMHLCPGRARFYGDLDDPASTVSELLKTRESFRLLEEKGTDPSVYFLK
jgi:molybdopterin-containing oxidoreductase family iron-sulfur binding subunit